MIRILVFGTDFRHLISPPDRAEIVQAIRHHYETIRAYGDADAGWLLDTARCLYTLKTNQVIAKTKAGEWALEQHLCPNPETMEQTLNIRKHPKELLNSASAQKWLNSLKPEIQRFADVLEDALRSEILGEILTFFPCNSILFI